MIDVKNYLAIKANIIKARLSVNRFWHISEFDGVEKNI